MFNDWANRVATVAKEICNDINLFHKLRRSYLFLILIDDKFCKHYCQVSTVFTVPRRWNHDGPIQ